MKRSYLLFSVLFALLYIASSASANHSYEVYYRSTLQQDTLKHLKEIQNKKSKFIGKELNSLLTELAFPVKSFNYRLPEKPGGPVTTITLFLGDIGEKNGRLLLPSSIIIKFDSELKEARKLFMKNFGKWSTNEKNYFGKQIISDIIVPTGRK